MPPSSSSSGQYCRRVTTGTVVSRCMSDVAASANSRPSSGSRCFRSAGRQGAAAQALGQPDERRQPWDGCARSRRYRWRRGAGAVLPPGSRGGRCLACAGPDAQRSAARRGAARGPPSGAPRSDTSSSASPEVRGSTSW